jgi:hypothetical protein
MANTKETKKVTIKANMNNRVIYSRPLAEGENPKNKDAKRTLKKVFLNRGQSEEFAPDEVKAYIQPDGKGHYKVKQVHSQSFSVV